MAINPALPEQLKKLDIERRRRYADNLAFYQGNQWERREIHRRRLTINYTRAMIDKLTSYLMGRLHFAVALDGSEPGRARATEAALLQVYEENALAQLDFDTEIDCAVLGDAAYRVVWDAVEERVVVTAPDVGGIFVLREGPDVRPTRVIHQYELPGRTDQVDVQQHAPTVRNTHVTEDWSATLYEKWVGNEVVASGPNPYGFIPYVIYPNIRRPKDFWGQSDIEQLCEVQRELNRATSQVSRILEVSGNPIAALHGVENPKDMRVEPGQVWVLPDQARAYLVDLLAGNGVKLHIEYLDKVYRAMHDLAEMPRTAFGDNSGAVTSGTALQIELDPLIKKVERKRLIRSVAYRRRNELILRLLTQFTGVDYSPFRADVVWESVLPSDRSQLVRNERELVAAGLHSRRRAANELGVEDPDGEFEQWLKEEEAIGDLRGWREVADPPHPSPLRQRRGDRSRVGSSSSG
jgi:Phage portal protein, SPP1 Gp6-like